MDEQSSEGPDPHSTKHLRDDINHNDQRKSRAAWREIVVGRFALESRSDPLDVTIIVLAPSLGASACFPAIRSVAGRPALRWVLDAARALEPKVLIGVGDHPGSLHQKEELDVEWVAEFEQASSVAGKASTALVVDGRLALIEPATLRKMVAHHQAQQATVTRILPARQESGILLAFADDWLWPALECGSIDAEGAASLDVLVDVAQARGKAVSVLGLEDPSQLLAVADPESLAQAEAGMRRRINRHWMLRGVTLIDPGATYIQADVQIGAGTIVWPNSFLQGETRIGRDCTIGCGSVIRDSSIGDGCRVELSVVEQAIMEEGSNIGPFGHLRKGAHLGPGVHMGNFGEVKNSYLGPGVKMGHFSYLGDATIGENTNIGAGTITCNFDGQRKHPTHIGKDAFIGSGAMLVSPLEIGEKATVGAGSVVTHDVPPGSVAYGVPARVRATPTDAGPEVE